MIRNRSWQQFALSRRELAFGLATSAFVVGPARAAREDASPPRFLRAAPAKWSLAPAPAAATTVLSYDDTVPGPIILARQGEDVMLRLENRLDTATSLHIAGMRLPNALDGIPGLTGKAIGPGEEAALTIPAHDAGFFTFGPAAPSSASEQAGRGLGGVLIVADPKDPAVDADILLVLKDWRLDASGAVEDSFADRAMRAGPGRLGNVLCIGGLSEARRLALPPGARFRVRIANACNARILPLKFRGMHPSLIGVSGQQSAVFTPLHGEMLIVPGGRYDLVCDIAADARPPAAPQILAAIGQGLPLLDVTVLEEEPQRRDAAPIAWLSDNGLPEIIDLSRALRADIKVERSVGPDDAHALASADPEKLWTLNGRSGSLDAPPLFSVKRGTPVVIAVTNTTDVAIVMKLNGHLARLLHPRDDGWTPYWIDVVLVGPGATERIAFVADSLGHWLFGGRILEHLAAGQFGWFEVS